MKYKGYLSPYVQQKQPQSESKGRLDDLRGNNAQLAQLVKDLMALKENIISLAEEKINEVVNPLMESHQQITSKIDQAISQIDTHRQMIKGDKGDLPKAGIDYRLPKDGKNPLPEEIVPLVLAKIPKSKNGRTPIKGIDYVDGKPGKNADPKDVVEYIKSNKAITSEHISGLDQTMEAFIEQFNLKKGIKAYVHGGGDTVKAGSNITLTRNSNGTVTISSTGGSGSGYQTPLTGGLTGTNTWTTAPNIIVVDGRPLQKVQTDGTINWTGTTNTVLAVPPNFDIYASA